MGRTDLRARGAGFEGGTVIEACVSARDDAYDLATLDFDGGQLKVPGVTAALAGEFRLGFAERGGTLALIPAGTLIAVWPHC